MASRQERREAWSRPTNDLHAVRRALARLRYNLNRRRQAQRRLRELEELLREFGYDPHGSLIGAGSAALARAYMFRFGRSRRQLYRDLAALKSRNWDWHGHGHGHDLGQGQGQGQGHEHGTGSGPTASPTGTGTGTGAASVSASTRQPLRPGQSAAAADSKPGAPAVSASTDPLPRLLAVLRREPCPTCGRLPGLPARTEWPGPWATAYVALRLTLTQQLEPGLVEALLVHASRLQAELRPPRRLGGLPPSPRSSSRHRAEVAPPSPPAPPARRPFPGTPALDAGPDLDPGLDVEVYTWRL
jgi:hypothetical protein